MRKPIQLATVVAAVLGATSLPGWAVDGVILIDQAKAMAFGVTPGVSYSVVTRNLGGINNGNGASLFGNTMRDNTSGNVVGAGANLGQNFCSGVGGSC